MGLSIDQIRERLEVLHAEISTLGPMLIGSLLKKRNRKTRKDGSEYISPPYYTLQYADAKGRRCWKRVPRKHKTQAQRLIKTGIKYRALEREYSFLSNELAQQSALKKRHNNSSSPAVAESGSQVAVFTTENSNLSE